MTNAPEPVLSAVPVECLYCGHGWIAMVSPGTDRTALECPHCGEEPFSSRVRAEAVQ